MTCCFSCRVEVAEGAMYLMVHGDPICLQCFRKFGTSETVGFEEWRRGEEAMELFSFDPYLERETDVTMRGPSAAGLLPVTGEVLRAIENLREQTGKDTNGVLRAALIHLGRHVEKIELRAYEMRYFARAIAQAMRGEDDKSSD